MSINVSPSVDSDVQTKTGQTRRARLAIADDHSMLLDGLRQLLEPRFDIVALVNDGRALVDAAIRLQPDLALLDISMPLLNGIEATAQIKRDAPAVKVMIMTMHSERQYIRAAFQAGASAYVLKQMAASEMIAGIEKVLEGKYYFTPLLAPDMDLTLLNEGVEPNDLFGGGLTPRQREVLQLIAEGNSAKEIAAILDISSKTVEFHKASIMGALGLRTTAKLTRYAIEQGIVGS